MASPSPALHPDNPGISHEGSVEFTADDGTRWTETFDLVQIMLALLADEEIAAIVHDGWLELPVSGLRLVPRMIEIEPREDGQVRTATTVQSHHARFPDGVFEFQYAVDETIVAAAMEGLKQWIRTDLVALLDATRDQIDHCTEMSMSFPPTDERPALKRRILFGPVAHYRQKPSSAESDDDDGHAFCPCCLFTQSIEAFTPLLESDEFYGLRLFASRDADGVVQSDCRVNGKDWERGAQALQGYVATWVEQGFEFRKQYVIVQSVAMEAADARSA